MKKNIIKEVGVVAGFCALALLGVAKDASAQGGDHEALIFEVSSKDLPTLVAAAKAEGFVVTIESRSRRNTLLVILEPLSIITDGGNPVN